MTNASLKWTTEAIGRGKPSIAIVEERVVYIQSSGHVGNAWFSESEVGQSGIVNTLIAVA